MQIGWGRGGGDVRRWGFDGKTAADNVVANICRAVEQWPPLTPPPHSAIKEEFYELIKPTVNQTPLFKGREKKIKVFTF